MYLKFVFLRVSISAIFFLMYELFEFRKSKCRVSETAKRVRLRVKNSAMLLTSLHM